MHTGLWLWATQSSVGPNLTASLLCSVPAVVLTGWRLHRRLAAQSHAQYEGLKRHVEEQHRITRGGQQP
jgi:hypothetical protein